MDRDEALQSPRHWFAPDRSLTDSGYAGELIVARTRLFLSLTMFVIPVIGATRADRDLVDFIALFGTGMLVVIALAVWSFVRRGGSHPWLPFATSLFDVTLVTAISVGYLIVGRGDVALNSRVTFPAYFIALAATCLRYDVRICLATGAAAILQYAIIIGIGSQRYPDIPSELATYYGRIDWSEQFGRIILLATATGLSATIVDRVRRLRLLSTHDGLTGLYNRTYFDERVTEELLRARRYKRPLAIAVMDLDHFKSVNDKYGHTAGDEVLRKFAALVTESFRRTDIVSRYGGEEFAVALPETEPAGAEAKLEEVRRLVESTKVSTGEGGPDVTLTFSAGIVHYPRDGDGLRDLVRKADVFLMSAKRAGRNRIIGTRAVGPG